MRSNNKVATRFLKSVVLLLAFFLFLSRPGQAGDREFYQLKIYSIENGQQELKMDKFLKDAYLPALHRAGIEDVGVFKPVEEEKETGKYIFVFIPFESMEQFEGLGEILNHDKKYRKAGDDYINAQHDDPPYQRIETILLRSFKSFPKHGVPSHSTPAGEQIFELRSYQGATERLYEKKVEMFNEGKESKLFIDLGFQPLFFGEVIAGSDMPNLMYMITFESRESQKKHWDAFVNSNEWNLLKGDEQYANTVSKIDKMLLHPTDYSDL